ncbi:MAG TPA: aldo/keto reductase [Acidimicrobiales bacterium]|jgi:D-threo-aldose 1-dehydrogenase|nr:aldo/keto reductase [Acidimicrobiales bacterium]
MHREATLGDYGFATSALGFGTASIFHEPSATARQRLLRSALDAGIRHFDVAPIYGLGLAEGELGRALRSQRERVVVVTKLGIGVTPLARMIGRVQSPARKVLQKLPSLQQQARETAASPTSGKLGGLLYRNTFDAAAAQRSLERSLSELGVEYLDVLMLHDPEPSQLNAPEMYDFLERARASGKIRAWGVAGEVGPTARVIDELGGAAPVAQIRDDIFRGESLPTPVVRSDYLISFGVLGEALPKIFVHVTANDERIRQWTNAVGADCSSHHVIATLLLKDAIRANPRGTVLYSTTRPERLQETAALFSEELSPTDASLDAFRELVRSQLGPNDAVSKDAK